MAKAASERSRPGCDQLISSWAAVSGDRADAGLGQQHRRHRRDQRAQLLLQRLGLGVRAQHPLGGQPQRQHTRSVLHRRGRLGLEGGAGAGLL
jgi:hypothetical protein